MTPACFLDLSSDEGTFGLYNVWLRFKTPGMHHLRIALRQVRSFYFTYPFDVIGVPDPLGLDGRRVFLQGESVGSGLDGLLVPHYTLDVVPWREAYAPAIVPGSGIRVRMRTRGSARSCPRAPSR